MKDEDKKHWIPPDNVEGIPMSDPVYHGLVTYIKDRIDEIQWKGLSELREDMLEFAREDLQEILDNWPNRPEQSAGK